MERPIALPELPIGRHRLIVDGVVCALTVAPPECYGPRAALRKRFGVAAQLYALRRAERSGDRRLLDAGARGRGRGPRRSGLSRRQPDAHAVPARPRAGEPLPPVRPALPRSDPHRRSRSRPAARRDARGRARRAERPPSPRPRRPGSSTIPRCGRSSAPRSKRCTRPSPARRASQPGIRCSPSIGRSSAAGGEALHRFAAFQAIAAGDARPGLARLAGAAARRRREGGRCGDRPRRAGVRVRASSASGSPTGSSRAASAQARKGGLEIGFYRDLAVGAAPDGAEAWAHAERTGAGRFGRRAARSLFPAGAELEPAGAQPADRRAARLERHKRALRRQHAPRRHAAHRPRDGPAAALPHPRGRQARPRAPISPIRSTI